MDDHPQPTKSARTRARIADAALTLFSHAGFNATSVRDIAERAGCDPALIIRYFGSKEALFTEVTRFDLALPDLRGLSPERAARRLADHFVAVWEGPETGERFRVLLRSAAAHEPSALRLREVFSEQVLPMVAGFRGASPPEDDPRNNGAAAAVASIILGTALTRYILLLPQIAEVDAVQVSDQVTAALTPLLASLQPKENTP